MEIKLRAHRLATIIECGIYILLLSIIGFIIYLRFYTDFLYKDGFNTSDDLDSFLYHHPYYFLVFAFLMSTYFFWMLKRCLIYLHKGYVAAINAEGIRLPNGYGIPWHDIMYMDIITTGLRFNKVTFIRITLKQHISKNFIDYIVKKIRHNIVVLSNFENPQNAYNQLNEFWQQYR